MPWLFQGLSKFRNKSFADAPGADLLEAQLNKEAIPSTREALHYEWASLDKEISAKILSVHRQEDVIKDYQKRIDFLRKRRQEVADIIEILDRIKELKDNE